MVAVPATLTGPQTGLFGIFTSHTEWLFHPIATK